MLENPFKVLGLVTGPVDDGEVVTAYERRLAECRKRISEENQRAAREESLIYAYAVLRDPRRREHYLDKCRIAPRIVNPADAPTAPPDPPNPPEPHGKNKPDSIRRLCECIDNGMIDGEIDPFRRRAIHARARLLGVTPFEAEMLMASAVERLRRKADGETDDDAVERSKSLTRLIVTCLTLILIALFAYTRL